MYSPASLISPRLSTLQDALTTGDTDALAVFWQEATEHGTPLIESDAEYPTTVLVTFVWRATTALQNVAVIGGIAGWNALESQMTRLLDTDVWFRTFRAPADAHTIYFLSLDDPLVPIQDPSWSTVWDAVVTKRCLRRDPLNPLTYWGYASVLKLPAAPPEPWLTPRADGQVGSVVTHPFRSAVLGNERTIRIYLPARDPSRQEGYTWLLLFDGDSYFNLPLAPILDNMIAGGHIPPMIVIGIDNAGPGTRLRELSCNPQFDAFVVSELLGFVQTQYPLATDPRHALIGGTSLGGLAAAYTAHRHPDRFGNVLTQSGAFSWAQGTYRSPDQGTDIEPGWLIRQFVQAPHQPLRFSLMVGTLERDFESWGTSTSTLAANRHMRDVLQACGYNVQYHEYSGGHDFIGWRITLPDALSYLTREGGF